MKINVLCPTYGRPRRVEEMLSCFLRQDNQDAHLTIFNDYPRQVLRFDHPRVTIINLARRCSTLGAKRHMMLECAEPGLVTYWDDDDIYLPNHLSYSLEVLSRFKTRCAKHHMQWIDGGHRMYRIGGAAWMNTVLADRDILLSVGGFDAVHNGTCIGMIQKLLAFGHINGPAEWDHRPPTFIYRMKDGQHHVSTEAHTNARASMDTHADHSLGDTIDLLPHWAEPYETKARASWDAVCAVPA